jgi:hypothetical protein
MQLVLAELCGRWGCSWQENVLNIILANLDGKSGLILLGILLISIFWGVLMLLTGLVTVYEFILFWGKSLLGIANPNKSQQQGDRILPTARFLGRTVSVANKVITVYRQKQDASNQANSQQQDTHEPDKTAVNSVSNESVNKSGDFEPKGKRKLATAKFLGRTLGNIAKN